MYRSYLTIFFRNALKHKAFTVLNLLSLIIGITSCILIALWVNDELSYNTEIPELSNVYQLYEEQHYDGGNSFFTYYTPGPAAKELMTKFPEVEYAARNSENFNSAVIKVGEKLFREIDISFADTEFFKIISPQVVAGDLNNALQAKGTAVITSSIAKKFYGEDFLSKDIIGSSIKLNNEFSYRVDAIIEDPANVTYPGNIFLEFTAIEDIWGWTGYTSWGNNFSMTYMKLHDGTDPIAFGEKVKTLIRDNMEESITDCFIKPMSDVYLYDLEGGGKIEYIKIFVVIGILILAIAVINFVNLSTARSGLRSKEVGVKKSFGASKPQLVKQFMIESFLISICAAIVSILMVYPLLPYVNLVTGKAMSFNPVEPIFLVSALGITVMTAFLAGIYPAFFMSQFRPIEIMKGKVSIKGGLLRKSLVVFQFAVSVLLVVSGIVIFKQFEHIQNKNIGMDKDNVVYFEVPFADKIDVFKQEVSDNPQVVSVTASNNNPVRTGMSTSNVHWQRKDPDTQVNVAFLSIDYNFINTMGMELVEGRDFSKSFGADSTNFIINESLAKLVNPDGALGESIEMHGRKGKVVGIVKNFNFSKVTSEISPMIFKLDPVNTNLILTHIAKTTPETIAGLQSSWEAVYPELPFELNFVDKEFQMMYEDEARLSKLALSFSIISGLIACLGLFGLVNFMAQQMMKEISIRKVLGANEWSLIAKLSSRFIKWVALANLIGLPIAYFIMDNWLSDYTYRISVSAGILMSAFFISILITLLTTIHKSWITARLNPTVVLRNE